MYHTPKYLWRTCDDLQFYVFFSPHILKITYKQLKTQTNAHTFTYIYIQTFTTTHPYINKQISYNLQIYNDLTDPDTNFI
jgi:hypothetical protein